MAPNAKFALREGDWKILADERLEKFELYNLAVDPREERDVQEAEPQRFAEMRGLLLRHNAAVEAEGPDWWKRLNPNGAKPLGEEKAGKGGGKGAGRKKKDEA